MADQDVKTPESQAEATDVSSDIRAAIAEVRGDSDAPIKMVMDRPRDETGRFTEGQTEPAKPQDTKRPVLTMPQKTPQTAEAPQDGTAPAAAPAAISAPVAWSADMKAKFPGLDPEVQKYIATREAEAHKAISRTDELTDLGRRAKEAAGPYEHIIRAEGGDTLGMLKDYLNYAYVFRTANPQQKVQALQKLAQQFNIPLGNPAQQGLAPNVIDPRLSEMQQRLERMEQERQQEVHQRQQDEQAGFESVFDDFASQPGHEHFETLRPDMGLLMTSGRAATLEEAYEMAAYANPETRAALLQNLKQSAVEQRSQGLNAQASAARRAAVSVTGAPGNSKPATNGTGSAGSVEDDLRAAFRQHAGRV